MKLSEIAHLAFHPAMLRGQALDLVIERLELEYVEWADEPVPMLSFRGETLKLPVRDWNLSVLARECGDDARALRGREVTLSVDTVNGYEFVALKVKPSVKTARPAARKRLAKRRSK